MISSYLIIAQAGSDSAAGIVGGIDARAIVLGLLTGIAFGAILQRVGASSYELIVNMLRLKDLKIMKFLLTAIAVGSVGMYLMAQLFPGQSHIGIAPLYLAGIVVGGLIFGVGWAVCGYCPGTSLVAMSEGKVDAAFTVLGGLTGALVLSLVWRWIEPALITPLDLGNRSLPEILGTPPLLMAAVVATLIVLFVFWLDQRQGGKSAEPGGRPGLLER